jgi:hypothetical protein
MEGASLEETRPWRAMQLVPHLVLTSTHLKQNGGSIVVAAIGETFKKSLQVGFTEKDGGGGWAFHIMCAWYLAQLTPFQF